ncbi:cytochrome c biogenesis protein CcdA [Rubrivirga sp. IMCC43871]|uniref:protein-disulfide reductase DsbD family protein n=1 Tax=Rubrivirga sp. IMCC43871 TaxID=3391575 RepID=UPI00399015FA
MRSLLSLLVVVAAFAAPSDAQPAFFGGAPPPDPDELVVWTGPSDPIALTPGEAASVRLGVTIADGWHVYALDSPTGLPLRVEAALPAGVRVDGLRQSPPIDAIDQALGEPVRWFEGEASVELAVLASGAVGAGEHRASVDVTFGVCDDQICLPPRTRTLPLQLAVATPAPAPPSTEGPLAEAPLAEGPVPADTTEADLALVPVDISDDDDSATAAVAAPPVRGGAGEGLAGFLLLAVGAGLAALLTPCVFPLVPLTVGAFSHGAGSRGGAVGRALGFGLAVVAVFTALGAAASVALGAAGAQQVAANPWVNLALGAAFVVFALSLLGLVELRLPARWATAVDGASRKRTGVMGTLLAALALAVVSFSCTAPFVGGLLATAAGSGAPGGWARPLLGMAAFSAAFATPFVVLAAAPGLAARLPRSGGWMATVKGTLGFVELAAALKFLSNADLVWGVGVLTRPVVVALTMAVALLAVGFLLGRLRVGPDAPPASIGAGRLLGATVALAAVLVLAPGLGGAAVPLADAFLPPRTAPADGPAADGELAWHTDDLDAARAEAAATDTPLFVDFTGYTCTNCRAMEASVFPAPEVAPLLADEMVRAKLFTDGRPLGPAFQEIQQMLTGTVAMPTYAVLSPSGEVVGVWSGMATPEDFAAFLRSALARV